MSQERQINIDAIVLKKTRQDREQAADLDDLVMMLLQQKQKIEELEKRLAERQKPK